MGKLFKITVALVLSISTITFANDTYSSKGYTDRMKEYLISADEAIKLIGKKMLFS